MNLKEFNTENTLSRTKSPAVSINTASGVFSFNEAACELLDLKPGSTVVLHQDQVEPADWYVEKLTTKEAGRGFALRGKDTKSGLSFNSTALARELLESCTAAFGKVSGKMTIAGQFTSFEKRKLFGIITASFKPNTRSITDADN